MMDMTEKIFENHSYGKAALKKMGEVPENFRLYMTEIVGKYPNFHGYQIEGAEFREAKTGPNKGKLSIMVKDTKRSAYVSMQEAKEEE